MKMEQETLGGVTVVRIHGVVKLGDSARELAAVLEELLSTGSDAVVLDLEEIDYLDSTGLGELVGYLQRFSDAGKRLALLNPHTRVVNLLKLTRLDEVFTIFTDRAAALEALGE